MVIREKKRFRGTESSPLELELIKWYQQQIDVGLRVTGINLKEKALQLNEKYEAHQRFQASSGWLDSFKKRWGVKCLSIQKEKKPTDYNISERFKKELASLINLNDTNLDFIYNCDETGLYWKMLPNKNLASNNEQCGDGLKKIKDRVTILACTNASGSHKIPLFVIGKYKEPKCFKKLTHLSIHYEYSTNQWMDRTLMLHWYENIFISEIKRKYDYDNNKNIKVLLIINNALFHPPADDLNAICEFCTVIFLPSKVTSLIQPLDQGIFEQLKKQYRKLFMSKLLVNISNDNIDSVIHLFDLLDCLKSCSRAWQNITADSIRKCWKNLIPLKNPVLTLNDESIDVATFHSLLSTMPEYSSLTLDDTANYLNSDDNECQRVNENSNDEDEFFLSTNQIQESFSNQDDKIPIEDALKCLNKFIKFYENEEDCSATTLQILEDINQDMMNKIITKKNI